MLLVQTNEGDRCVNRLFQLKILGIVAEVWTGFCGITELIPDAYLPSGEPFIDPALVFFLSLISCHSPSGT